MCLASLARAVDAPLPRMARRSWGGDASTPTSGGGKTTVDAATSPAPRLPNGVSVCANALWCADCRQLLCGECFNATHKAVAFRGEGTRDLDAVDSDDSDDAASDVSGGYTDGFVCGGSSGGSSGSGGTVDDDDTDRFHRVGIAPAPMIHRARSLQESQGHDRGWLREYMHLPSQLTAYSGRTVHPSTRVRRQRACAAASADAVPRRMLLWPRPPAVAVAVARCDTSRGNTTSVKKRRRDEPTVTPTTAVGCTTATASSTDGERAASRRQTDVDSMPVVDSGFKRRASLSASSTECGSSDDADTVRSLSVGDCTVTPTRSSLLTRWFSPTPPTASAPLSGGGSSEIDKKWWTTALPTRLSTWLCSPPQARTTAATSAAMELGSA
jgi:hypothetical protein